MSDIPVPGKSPRGKPRPLWHYLVVLVTLAVVPLFVIAAALVARQASVQRGAIDQSMLSTARAVSVAVDLAIEADRTALEALAQSDFVDQRDWARMHAYATRVAAQRGATFIALYDLHGVPVFNTTRPFGSTALPAPLRQAQPATSDTLAVGSTSSLKRVLQTGQPGNSDLHISLSTGKPMFTLDIPVMREGAVVYVLNMGLEPGSISQVLQGHREGQVGLIVDGNGWSVGRLSDASPSGRKASAALLAALEGRNFGSASAVSIEGKPIDFSFVRSSQTGWTAAIGAPHAEVSGPVRDAWLQGSALAAIGLAIGLLCALLLARRLSASVAALASLGRLLGGGARAQIPLAPLRLSNIQEADALEHTLLESAELHRAFVEHERAQEALEREPNLLAKVMQATDVMLVCLDPDFNFVWVNEAYAATCRMRPEEMVGKNHFVLYPNAENEAIFRRVRDTGEPMFYKDKPFEFPDQPERGTTYWDWSLSTVDAGGAVVGMVLSLRETTQYKRAELALRESEERFRLLVEGVTDHAIFMLAPDGAVTSWNAGAERLKGYRVEEILGQNFARFYPEEDIETGKPQRELGVAAAKGRFEDDGWRVRKDGSRFWANVVITALHDEAGRVRGFSKITRDFTERKTAERRLAYLASFPEQNPNPIVEADLDGQVRYANPAALRLFPGVYEKGPAHAWLSGWETLARSIREGSAGTNARVVTVGDRSYYQVLAYLPEQRVARVYGLDTTERLRAEEDLSQSEERFRALTTASSDVVYRMSPDWSELRQLRGRGFIADTEAPSRTWLREYIHPDDQSHVMAVISEAIRAKSIFQLEHRVVRVDGSLGWTFSRAVPILDANGEIVEWFGAASDVTARKQSDEELKRSRQGLSLLAEASLRVMRETDLDPMFQAISSAALELTGARIAITGHGHFSGQFVIGGTTRAPGMPDCPPDKVFAIEKGGVYMELLEGAGGTLRLTDEQMRAHPRWWGLPEGHVPMHGLLGVRLVDRHERANGMILVTEKEQGDFTTEDESLLRQLGTLASLALQHVEARVSLEEADRAKNEFMAMLSHELRNPLAPISIGLSILERAAPGSDQAQRAQVVISRQVSHMTRLVDDLLDVTRVSRGKIRLQRESLDFTDVVRRSVEDHRALFTTNSLDLQVSIPDEEIRINGDRTRVAQLIGNLLGNAVKFTPPGGRVSVSVQNSKQLGQAIARVRDTGAGIAPEMLSRIFQPFVQADTSLDRSKGGLGLGLALVKGVMELHGGTASVESEGLGKGAEFTVRFPLETGLPPAQG